MNRQQQVQAEAAWVHFYLSARLLLDQALEAGEPRVRAAAWRLEAAFQRLEAVQDGRDPKQDPQALAAERRAAEAEAQANGAPEAPRSSTPHLVFVKKAGDK